jgi:metal-responsive CopG/Arc/MetJ family transcriptional regulator
MSSSTVKFSVYLDVSIYDAVTRLSNKTGSHRTDIVRLAVEQYLAFQSGQSWNPNRIAELVEYSQMAIDQVLLKIAPETRDEIIDGVEIRMEKYHGG